MNGSQFGILEAVKRAYVFTGSQWRYLLRAGMGPLAIRLGTVCLVQYAAPTAGIIETFLWSLPANIAGAWFLFVAARLLLLGERIDQLPKDLTALAARRRAMTASVIVLLLFDMALAAISAYMSWSLDSKTFGNDAAVTVSVLLLMCGMVWGLRFSVVHILAAVGYPIRAFLRRVEGMAFSFRLIGLGFICVLPVYLPFEFLIGSAMAPLPPEPTAADIAPIALASTPVAVLVSLLLSNAAAFALKDMLSRGER